MSYDHGFPVYQPIWDTMDGAISEPLYGVSYRLGEENLPNILLRTAGIGETIHDILGGAWPWLH